MSKKSAATTTISGLRYAYLHGFASSPLSSKGLALKQKFQDELNTSLDIPDLNIPSFRKQCLSKIVDHVERIIVESNSAWSFIGSSFGGLVATLVARRQPDSIRSLLLLAPAFDATRIWLSKVDIEQWKNTGHMNFFNQTTKSDEPLDYEFFVDLQRHPSYPLVTTCPVTIVHGIRDDVVPIETSREYIRRLSKTSQQSISMIELDDDHRLLAEKTLRTIEKIVINSYHAIIYSIRS